MARLTVASSVLTVSCFAEASYNYGVFANMPSCTCLTLDPWNPGPVRTTSCTTDLSNLGDQSFFVIQDWYGDVLTAGTHEKSLMIVANPADYQGGGRASSSPVPLPYEVVSVRQQHFLHPSGMRLKRSSDDYLVLTEPNDAAEDQLFEFHSVADDGDEWGCSGPPPTAPPPSAFPILSTASSLCLDLPGGDTTNGALLWTWGCYGGETQQWEFNEGQLVYSADPSKCVDLLGGDSSNGNQLGIWDCYQGDSQMWGFDDELGTIYLASSSSSDATKCAQIGGTNRGDPVIIWDCTVEAQQIWTLGWTVAAPPFSVAVV